MAQDEGKTEEEKFDFTSEREVLGYISLDQARVLAVQHARENTDFKGYVMPKLTWCGRLRTRRKQKTTTI
tara:strand:+ start:200 stop:409 length:210 start_codon:yes stop_codon:yes gene_type:complete